MEMVRWPELDIQDRITHLEKEHAHEQALLLKYEESVRVLHAKLAIEKADRKNLEQFCLQLADEVLQLKKSSEKSE